LYILSFVTTLTSISSESFQKDQTVGSIFTI